jgi:hypothetical protein
MDDRRSGAFAGVAELDRSVPQPARPEERGIDHLGDVRGRYHAERTVVDRLPFRLDAVEQHEQLGDELGGEVLRRFSPRSGDRVEFVDVEDAVWGLEGLLELLPEQSFGLPNPLAQDLRPGDSDGEGPVLLLADLHDQLRLPGARWPL